MGVANKTILITGGTSGIGLALVNQLCTNNTILVMAKSAEKMEALFLDKKNIHCYPCNLASTDQITDSITQIIQDFPEISILINNAGIQFTPLFTATNFSINSITEEIQVNFQAPLLLTALLIKHWNKTRQQAAILNISSALAISPKTSAAVYCATKAALHNFSCSLDYQLEQTPISVYEAILPLVDTPMTSGKSGKKISAELAAKEIIFGFCKQKKRIYVGKTKWIPLLNRINPTLIAKILKKY